MEKFEEGEIIEIIYRVYVLIEMIGYINCKKIKKKFFCV